MSPRAPRRHAMRGGQNVVEVALILPLLLLLAFGVFDLGRAFGLGITTVGSARSGLREGIQNTTNDTGLFIRGDFGSNTNWGSEEGPPFGGPAAVFAHCPTPNVAAGESCGDPNGCPPASFAPTQDSCFAIGSCTLVGATCNPASITWNMPVPKKGDVLVVRVVSRLQLITGLVAAVTGRNIYIAHDQFAYPLY